MTSLEDLATTLDDSTDSALRRSQKVLDNVRAKLSRSEQLDTGMRVAIKTSWGLSPSKLEQKLVQVYGEPSERELYFAQKALNKALSQTDNVEQKPRKYFFVNNPI